jgi:hypothetical protein
LLPPGSLAAAAAVASRCCLFLLLFGGILLTAYSLADPDSSDSDCDALNEVTVTKLSITRFLLLYFSVSFALLSLVLRPSSVYVCYLYMRTREHDWWSIIVERSPHFIVVRLFAGCGDGTRFIGANLIDIIFLGRIFKDGKMD